MTDTQLLARIDERTANLEKFVGDFRTETRTHLARQDKSIEDLKAWKFKTVGGMFVMSLLLGWLVTLTGKL